MNGISTFKLPNRGKLSSIRIDEVFGDDLKTTIKQGKSLARGSVANLFGLTRGQSKKYDESSDEEEKALPARPVSHSRVVPTKTSVPPLDISDDLLDRLFLDRDKSPKRPTSKFFSKQRNAHTRVQPEQKWLDAEDIIHMFAGAPYFDVEYVDNQARPRVHFGWGPNNRRDELATDCRSLQHKSYEVCTAAHTEKIVEVPTMLEAYGKDPGTIGSAYFLQLPVREEVRNQSRTEQQQLLIDDPDILGLRDFDIENILDRLSELSKVYSMLILGKGEAAEWSQAMIDDIGEDLFATLLSGDLGTTAAGTGNVSLSCQIQALQRVLYSDIWYDFSRAETRKDVSRILFDSHPIEEDFVNERDALMLQIALSAELAVRLEIAQRLSTTDFRHAGVIRSSDLAAILKQQTPKLQWDIFLFKRFTQSFRVDSNVNNKNPLHRLSFSESMSGSDEVGDDLTFNAKQEKLQSEGLQAFAADLGWKHMEGLDVPKSDSFLTPHHNNRSPSRSPSHSPNFSEYNTPLSSPALSPEESSPVLVFNRSERSFDVVPAGHGQYHARSSLARAWFSGFIMPGPSIEHCLIQALLEHSGVELASSPSDGFVYDKSMYWNMSSVAARVLAPAEDVKESMGWISLPFVPQDCGNGWIEVKSKPTQYLIGDVARASDPLHQCEAAELRAGDFTTPLDGHLTLGNEASFLGVSLTASGSASVVNLTFRSPRNHKMPALTLPLTHSVYFVSSYPCYPYTKRQTGKSPSYGSPLVDSGAPSPLDKDLPMPPAHPLHNGFTYKIIPAAALLSSTISTSDSLSLVDSPDDPPSIYDIQDEDVVVLDCRGSADLEVLSRSWCAKVGENALISKMSRTCLACSVREAVGLSIGVVIRTS